MTEVNNVYVYYSRKRQEIVRTEPPDFIDYIPLKGTHAKPAEIKNQVQITTKWAFIPTEVFNLISGKKVPVNVRFVD